MKGWTPLLNALFVTIDWLAQIVLSPITLMVAIGFIVFTALIGRQMQREKGSPWIRVA